MKYLSDQTWGSLPINDFRPRFFIETYREKLSLETPHFSKSRLMNLLSSCAEALSYIQEYRSSDRNGGYILSALDEIEGCLSSDPVAQELFGYMDEPRAQLFKKIRGGDFNPTQLTRLAVICQAVLTRDEEYSSRLLGALKDSLFSQVDLTKMERITSTIYTLTGLYTTYLLNKGYSPTYLFNRAELFTRESNYSGKTFHEQFDMVTERLRSYTTTYEVIFSLRAHKSSCLLSIEDDADFVFLDSIPESIQGSDREKLSKDFVPNVIAKSSIESTDYVSASWLIKEKLDKLLDSVTALELNPRIQVSAHCVTISRNQNKVHTKTLNINLLLEFLSSEGGTYFSSSDATIRHALAKLNSVGREQLGRSLRYLRLARESISLEQKLLNMWISMESIFSDGESSILSNIVEYVPQIYAVSALTRRVRYLREMLVKNGVLTTPLVKRDVIPGCDRFDDSVSVSQVFDLLRNESAALELFNSLSPKEHLKYKLLSTYKEMQTNATIADRVRRSEVDVTRQLRRIYFLRNKIAHTGHYANIRPQLVTHLLDYLAVCYMAISTAATRAVKGEVHSIADMLAAYKMGADVVASRCKAADPITKLEQLVPTPII